MRKTAPAASSDVALLVAFGLWGLVVALGPRSEPLLGPGGACPFPAHLVDSGARAFEVGCASAPPQNPAVHGAARLLFGLPLDLNVADARALESLPRIGPARAAAIVRSRCVRAFPDLDSISRVSGIGPRTVEGLRGWAVADAQPDCIRGPDGEAQGPA